VALTAMRPFLRREPPPPAVSGQLPGFRLVTEGGREFGLEGLADRVWIVNLFFTRCPSICPRVTLAMGALQGRLEREGVDGVHLLSITVDPAYDTPARLRDFAEQHGARAERWSWVTGEPAEIGRLLERGFDAPIAPAERELAEGDDIAHTGQLILVDGSGRLRGRYDSDALGVDEVFHRAGHVLREQQRR